MKPNAYHDKNGTPIHIGSIVTAISAASNPRPERPPGKQFYGQVRSIRETYGGVLVDVENAGIVTPSFLEDITVQG